MTEQHDGTLSPSIHHGGRDARNAAISGATALFEQLMLSDLDRMTIVDLLRHAPEPDDTGLSVILGLLFAALGEGSLCLSLEGGDLLAALSSSTADSAVVHRIDAFRRRLDDGHYDGLVDRTGGGAYKPLVLDTSSGRRLLYFQKFHHHEQRLKMRLGLFLQSIPQRKGHDASIERMIELLYDQRRSIRKGAGKVPIVRDPFQVEAIRAALTTPLLVISGGPGTGKTSLLVNILRALVQTGADPSRIKLAAPTGRAAQRMTEALHSCLATIDEPMAGDVELRRLSGSTLHKLLIYSSHSRGFVYGERNPIPAEVIVVDEVSMVDVVMMDNLFQAVDTKRTRVVLLGDKDQLPSVEAGSVLADMSMAAGGSLADNFVTLGNVYRATGRLLELAQAINGGQPVPLQPVGFDQALDQLPGDWAFVSAGDQARLNRCVDRWALYQYVQPMEGESLSYADRVLQLNQLAHGPGSERHGGTSALFDTIFELASRCRILTVLRNGPRGMQRVNERIAAGLRSILDYDCPPENKLFNGALIMVTRNDYRRELYNGDVGVVLRQRDGTYLVWFKRSGGIMALPFSALSEWDLGFAMTVHKSQGSEFADTLLILPEDPHHRLLTREIVYTAATRAARRLIVYGSQAAFQTALQRRIQRRSGLVVQARPNPPLTTRL